MFCWCCLPSFSQDLSNRIITMKEPSYCFHWFLPKVHLCLSSQTGTASKICSTSWSSTVCSFIICSVVQHVLIALRIGFIPNAVKGESFSLSCRHRFFFWVDWGGSPSCALYFLQRRLWVVSFSADVVTSINNINN